MKNQMTAKEFDTQMERLKNVYGEKAFPLERERMVWKRYQNFPYLALMYAVDWIVLKMPGAASVISEIDEKLSAAKTYHSKSEPPETHYFCEPCRDFGYGWIGETIRACVCDRGHQMNPLELLKQQKNYDSGDKIMNLAKKKSFGRIQISKPLPYDPNERQETEACTTR